jgi:hypothetical protein
MHRNLHPGSARMHAIEIDSVIADRRALLP